VSADDADPADPGAPIWFQTAEGKTARAVPPPWENAKSRRRARRHPDVRRDASGGEKQNTGGDDGDGE